METGNDKHDYANSKALFVLKIITMSFAILAFAVAAAAMLTRLIMDLEKLTKNSNSKIARASAKLNKFRKDRIKHILRQRKLQLREEKEYKRKKDLDRAKKTENVDGADFGADCDCDEITDEEKAINDFDNELRDILGDGDIDLTDGV